MKAFGFAKVMEPLVQDLLDHGQDGMLISRKSRKAFEVCVAADNLGAHQLRDLTECFSLDYVCRFCHTTLDKVHHDLHMRESLQRQQMYEDNPRNL